MLQISDADIRQVEELLLPDGCKFPEDARKVIRCWESKDVAACPGSGKTTVLLAKLKSLADRMPLDNGSGICVLSHTNVAVNEIKEKECLARRVCAQRYPPGCGIRLNEAERFDASK